MSLAGEIPFAIIGKLTEHQELLGRLFAVQRALLGHETHRDQLGRRAGEELAGEGCTEKQNRVFRLSSRHSARLRRTCMDGFLTRKVRVYHCDQNLRSEEHTSELQS